MSTCHQTNLHLLTWSSQMPNIFLWESVLSTLILTVSGYIFDNIVHRWCLTPAIFYLALLSLNYKPFDKQWKGMLAISCIFHRSIPVVPLQVSSLVWVFSMPLLPLPEAESAYGQHWDLLKIWEEPLYFSNKLADPGRDLTNIIMVMERDFSTLTLLLKSPDLLVCLLPSQNLGHQTLLLSQSVPFSRLKEDSLIFALQIL